MAELSSLQEKGTKSLFKKVLAKGAILTKNALPILLKAAVSKYLDKEVLKELFVGIADSANELLQTQIQEYTSKKEGLKEFRTALEDFVQKSSDGKPIIFIIDELDRCRPDYAVDVLEKVKHFFGVPGIVFVLSMDKVQLGHAIRGVYGSEKLNVNEYLRRFIDIEYSIPEPDTDHFCRYLFEYFDFGKFFALHDNINIREYGNDKDKFIDTSIQLFENDKLSLRQQEKILSHARVVLSSFNPKFLLFPELLLILIYFKIFHLEFYQQIRIQKLSIKELIDAYELIIPRRFSDKRLRIFIFIEAQLVFFYNNYINPREEVSLFVKDDNQVKKLLYNSNLVSDEPLFEVIIKRYSENIDVKDLELSYLLDKIDFIENVNLI